MKKYNCHECDEEFETENREEMLNILHAHYMEVHPDIIPNATDDEKKAWMEKFDKKWNETKED